MRQASGFTLIEILLVMAVISIMAAMTVPMIAGAMERYYVISAGQQVASTIRLARFQAVARNSNVQITFDEAAGTYQTEVWDSVDMAWDALGEVQILPRDITFVGAPADIAIEPTGRTADTAGCPCTITVSNENDDTRTITVSRSGRVQLQ